MGKKKTITIIEKTEVYEQEVKNATYKLNELKKKLKQNPPESVRKKKSMAKKLDYATIMLNRAKDRLNISQLYDKTKNDGYDVYANAQYELDDKLSGLEKEKKLLEREINSLDDIESRAATRRKRIESNRPDGYKPRERNTDNKKAEDLRKQQLEKELKRIEEKIAIEEEKMGMNDLTYSNIIRDKEQICKQELARIEEEYNQALAISKPNLFERIKNWWQERKNKATAMLSSKLEEAEKSSERKTFLEKTASGIPLQEQADNAAIFQQMFREETDEYMKPEENGTRSDDGVIDI